MSICVDILCTPALVPMAILIHMVHPLQEGIIKGQMPQGSDSGYFSVYAYLCAVYTYFCKCSVVDCSSLNTVVDCRRQWECVSVGLTVYV